jgi:hypothetical protein
MQKSHQDGRCDVVRQVGDENVLSQIRRGGIELERIHLNHFEIVGCNGAREPRGQIPIYLNGYDSLRLSHQPLREHSESWADLENGLSTGESGAPNDGVGYALVAQKRLGETLAWAMSLEAQAALGISLLGRLEI